MNLTREMAKVIACALDCAWCAGQGAGEPEAELKIWKLIGLLYPDLLETYTHIPEVKEAIQCPLNSASGPSPSSSPNPT